MKRILLGILVIISLSINAQKVTTLASLPNSGDGMTITPDGDVLIAGGYSRRNITKVTKDGEVSTFMEDLDGPVGLAYDSKGNLFVSNYPFNTISKIDPNMVVTEFASNLDGPAGLFINKNDEIFVGIYGKDFSGTGGRIIKINQNGSKSTYASGSGLSSVIGVTMDEDDNMYVTNFFGGAIYLVNPTNKAVTKIGEIEGANINQIAYANGYLYIPVPNQGKIYRLNTETHEIEHFAGNGNTTVKDGDLLEAGINTPNSMTTSITGDTLYILDNAVRKLRRIAFNETTSSKDEANQSLNLKVEQNYPNPFSAETTIKFTLFKRERVVLSIIDNQGKKVDEIINESKGSGEHFVKYVPKNLTGGIYYYKLTTDTQEVTKEMIHNK